GGTASLAAGGTAVASRVVDEAAGVTRFELLPKAGDTTLLMTLNSHLQRDDPVVVVCSVVVDELTEAYEKLHADVSLEILHRAMDRFRFAVPRGFEVTRIDSPLLARWDVQEEDGRKVLSVQLREQTTGRVLLNLSAVKTPAELDAWKMPRLQLLPSEDFDGPAGDVAVVGLLVEDRLNAESIVAEGLISIDTGDVRGRMPATLLKPEPGAPPLRLVAAYYAPQAGYNLSARITSPPAELTVRTNTLLVLQEKGLEVRGGLAMVPKVDKLFEFDLTVPPAWHVTSVLGPNETPLKFERYEAEDEASRTRVRLPHGVQPGEEYVVNFHAVHTPPGWLDNAAGREIAFPQFSVATAAGDSVAGSEGRRAATSGAIAVQARDDMTVRQQTIDGLTPLARTEKKDYGLADVATNLAYRYESPPYSATLLVERTRPRLTATTYSFLRVEPDAIRVRYEIIYTVEEARTRHVSLRLPKETTPETLDIRGLGGLKLKRFESTVEGEFRRWTVELDRARRGNVHLMVAFEQPLPVEGAKDLALPIVAAEGEGLAYQTGLVAVEGTAERDVQVKTTARRVHVGELVDAQYRLSKRLLGVYRFAGEPTEGLVKIDVTTHPGYALYSAIVEKAMLSTYLSADGTARTKAQFMLRAKAQYVEVLLPEGAQLWSAVLDGTPVKPQRDDKSLLVSLPADTTNETHDLQVVYASQVGKVGFRGEVDVPAPKLFLRGKKKTSKVEVPLAGLVWQLHPPSGYRVVHSGGTVVPDSGQLVKPELAALQVAGGMWALTGGVRPWLLLAAGQKVRESGRRSMGEAYNMRYSDDEAGYVVDYGDDAAADDTPAADDGDYDPAEEPPMDDDAPADAEAPPLELVVPEEPAATEPATPSEGGGEGGDEDGTMENDPDQVFGRPIDAPVDQSESTATAVLDTAIVEALSRQTQITAQEIATKPRDLKGVRSLRIDPDENAVQTGDVLTFRSLGAQPRLVVTLADRQRFSALGWGLALAVGLVGLAMTNHPTRRKMRWIVLVALPATLLPLGFDDVELAQICNMLFFAAILLVPYYLAVAVVRRCMARCACCCRAITTQAAAATTATILLAAMIPTIVEAAPPSSPVDKAAAYLLQMVEPLPPVTVPADAVILPYDADSETGMRDADKLLVPYAKYVELWNRAHPDEKIGTEKLPVPFALAGASYNATLSSDEYLLVTGQLEIDVFADGYVAIPLRLAGGVLSRADLDGKPARLRTLEIPPPPGKPVAPPGKNAPSSSRAKQQHAPGLPTLLLYVRGKGRHKLELAVRLPLTRQGGWRVVEGTLPNAPAGTLTLTVPEAATNVRLARVADRLSYETEQPNEKIDSVLGTDGSLSVQWRAKVAEGQVDRGLTAESLARLDVQEDGLRLVWQLALKFPRSQRDELSFAVPADYLIENVDGANVRGWTSQQADGRQQVDVALLNTAKGEESLTVHLWRSGAVGRGDTASPAAGGIGQFDVPAVEVDEAVAHRGELLIRRSRLLQLQTREHRGATRNDLGGTAQKLVGSSDSDQSPLHVQPYQAYRLDTTPFAIRLTAAEVTAETTAEVFSVLRLLEHEQSLESNVVLDVQNRPIHRIEIFVPDELEIGLVEVPGTEFTRAVTRETVAGQDGRRLLTIFLAAGRQGKVSVQIEGVLGRAAQLDRFSLPRLEVRGVTRQQGDIAVQIDSAYDVRAQSQDLENCEVVLLQELHGWLNPNQREITRLPLHYTRPDYRGTLRLTRRGAIVTCTTISNVKVTDRAVEETIVLDFTVTQAAVGEVSFLLPVGMEDCRIGVPMLREKTIEPVVDADGTAMLRVRLQLQDKVMGQLRVQVYNDRLLTTVLTAAKDAVKLRSVPIPIVETGRTQRRYVTVESAGEAEVVVEAARGLNPLARQQKEFGEIRAVLGDGVTQAYLAQPGAKNPRLDLAVKTRKTVETTGARIGLAETTLVYDATGAYRAEATYHLFNTTEQFLAIQLPVGARLWTARVAGQPVKPVEMPAVKGTVKASVHVPLVKTADGDLDYEIVLYYGGKASPLGAAGGTVGFPLLGTANVQVARSQVRLFVPKTHQWFDFGGTMHRQKDEDDLKAEIAAYKREELERLRRTMQHGDKFAQVLASGNVGSWKTEMKWSQSIRDDMYESSPNEKLRIQLSANASILAEAEAEQGKLAIVPEQQHVSNRGRLNLFYEDQQNTRSWNVVKDAGGNWSNSVVTAQAQPNPNDTVNVVTGEAATLNVNGGSSFNPGWFDNNGLNVQLDAVDANAAPQLQGGTTLSFRPQSSSNDLQAQPAAPEIAQGRTKAALVQAGKFGPDLQTSQSESDRTRENVLRYREEVAVANAAGNVLGGKIRAGGGEYGLSTGYVDSGDQLDSSRGNVQFRGGVETVWETPTTGRTGQPVPPGSEGLDSLVLRLPGPDELKEHYREYLFTTALGDVEITARAASQDLLDNLTRLAALLAALAVAACITRAIRRGRLTWPSSPRACVAMILIGLLSLVIGILPLAGLAVMIAGVVLLIRTSSADSKAAEQPVMAEAVQR
ncbi:MAG: hypothetical protein HQ567_11890, partial [Candidatus Nealsonbacteria bacterium]|nr:hypothetical protein [Candidatus Nealsonbacteria bacterium]